MTQDITFILFYFILFLFQSEYTIATALRKSINDEKTFPDKCQYCEGLQEKVKRETRTNLTKEKKSKYFQKLNDNFYKYKYPGKPSQSYSLSKAWGATGMPFNVLYTPNKFLQKILKFVSRREQMRKYPEPKKNAPEIYNLVLEKGKRPQKAKESLIKKQSSSRKYYSLIPQFFVSYGW